MTTDWLLNMLLIVIFIKTLLNEYRKWIHFTSLPKLIELC